MDTSLLDRRFREAKGITLKAYIDGVLKERLIIMLDKGQRYGFECASALGFQSDQAFYHWVKRVFGISFRQLRSHPTIHDR